jgi:hypothetical protein
MGGKNRLSHARKFRRRAAAALAAAGALVMSSGLIVLAASSATALTEHKTSICHRTAADSNPYVFEDVDDSSLDAHYTNQTGHPVRYWKSAGTWRNVAHKAGDPRNDYPATSAADCRDTTKPPVDESIRPNPSVVVADKCGTAEDSVTLSRAEEYTGVDNHNGTATFTAEPGFVFSNGQNTFVVTYTPPGDVACPGGSGDNDVPAPGAPGVNDPCGPGNATWVVPADTGKLDWELLGNGDLTVTSKTDTFKGSDSSTINFGTAQDSGVLCPSSSPPPPPVDVCSNIPGDQAAIPGGFESDGNGGCVKPVVVVPTDVCTNMPGVQVKVPKGYQAIGGECAQVLGVESMVPQPKPTKHTHAVQPVVAPTVLGTEAIAPTAVDAGLASWPTSTKTTTSRSMLAQGLVGGGLLMLVAGGSLGLGTRKRGMHQV